MRKFSRLSTMFLLIVLVISVSTFTGCDVSTSKVDTNNTQETEVSSKNTSVNNTQETEVSSKNTSVCNHSYAEATCTEAKKCSRCGTTNGSALGHKWSNATCQTPKKCARCGITEGNKAQHNMNNQGVCSSCGKDVFSQFVKENVSIQLIVPSVGASDNYYCEVKFINHTGYNITLNSYVYANGKGCVNLDAGDYTLETDYSVKISFYRSVVPANRWDEKYKDMYLDNNSTATTSIEINGRHANIRFGINGTIDIENTY